MENDLRTEVLVFNFFIMSEYFHKK